MMTLLLLADLPKLVVPSKPGLIVESAIPMGDATPFGLKTPSTGELAKMVEGLVDKPKPKLFVRLDTEGFDADDASVVGIDVDSSTGLTWSLSALPPQTEPGSYTVRLNGVKAGKRYLLLYRITATSGDLRFVSEKASGTIGLKAAEFAVPGFGGVPTPRFVPVLYTATGSSVWFRLENGAKSPARPDVYGVDVYALE